MRTTQATNQELTSSVVLSPTTAREGKGREEFVPSPNALSQARDITWPTPHGAMLLDRDTPARNPSGPSRCRPRAATPRSGEPRAPPTTTREYPSSPSPLCPPGARPLATIPAPGGGRRQLGLPPWQRPPPGHLPRCDIAAAGTLP